MQITLSQIILIFLASCLIGAESILDEFQLHRPILACPLIGWILNDLKTGIILGGTLEVISLGWMNIGAAVSPDTALASIISTILVIVSKQSIGSGIAMALPISATGQILTILVRSLTIALQHLADKKIKRNQNLFFISCIHICALFLQSMRVAIPTLIILLSMSTEVIQKILRSIPLEVTNGLNISGGIIVVVGYAMVINMMKTKSLMPFFYLGFTIAAFTKFNLVGLGIIAIVLAILYIQLSPKYYIKEINEINNKNKKNAKDDELD